MFRRATAFTLVVTVSWTTWAVAAPFTPLNQALTYEDAMEELDRFMEVVEELRAHIDRSQFDLEALLERLDYDADSIRRFVTEQIYFEQYPGVLRGAQGTLMSRAGNSLDQAILLATLLKDSGFEVRIARGRLTPDQAKLLISQMSGANRERAHPLDQENLKGALLRLADRYELTTEERERLQEAFEGPEVEDGLESITDWELYREARSEADRLIAILAEAGVPLQPEPAASSLVEEAQEYFWVQWRRGPAMPWEEVHPAWREQTLAPNGTAVLTFYGDTIPAELQHRFRLEVTIEQAFGGEIRTHHLMEPWERPVANLIGETITYMNLPDKLMSREGYDDPSASIHQSTYFLPLLNGNLPEGAMTFDVDGNVISPDALQGGYAGVFRQLFGKTEKAATALDALGKGPSKGEEKDLVYLAAHKVDYVFLQPGGAEIRTQRIVIDENSNLKGRRAALKNPDPAMRRAINRRLTEETSFALAVGEYPPAFILDRFLERLLKGRGVIELAIDEAFFPNEPRDLQKAKGARLHWGEHFDLFSKFDSGVEFDSATLTYRADSSLIAYRREMTIGDDVRGVVDVVRNVRRAFRVNGTEVLTDKEAAIRSGVWETWAETTAVRDGPILASAAGLVRRSEKDKLSLHVISPDNAYLVGRLGLPAEARIALRRDIDDGYHVVVPSRPVHGSKDWGAWYRIRVATGETLGMVGGGLGATATEYVILLISITVGLYFFLRTFEDCRGEPLQGKHFGRFSESPSEQRKTFGCTLCAAFAGVVAGIFAYLGGMYIAGHAATAGTASALSKAVGFERGSGIAGYLRWLAWSMARKGFAPEIIKSALAEFTIQAVCLETSLSDSN